jgi:hypothetical protein
VRRSATLKLAFAACAAAFSIGAAKTAPAPPFVPALAYKYGSQELRLANADGSQAVLLARFPAGTSPLWLSIAPISKRQVAYIEGYGGSTRSVRIINWTQATVGGPLTVTVDAQPILSLSGSDGLVLTGLDYSPDGTRLAILATDSQARTELRFFDVATRSQVGDAVPLQRVASTLAWRPSDGAILLRGTQGMAQYKDGIETPLFGGNQTTDFDTFNGTSADVILPYSGTAPGGSTWRWDGATVNADGPALTKLADGLGWSVSCDNSRMIYKDFALRQATYSLVFGTGEKILFSKDSSVQRVEYPNSCS